MLKPPPRPEQYDTLSDTATSARPVDDFGAPPAPSDPIENLTKLRQMLIEKRRYLAQDAMTYPVVFVGRSLDIAELQKLINALTEAIEQELAVQASS